MKRFLAIALGAVVVACGVPAALAGDVAASADAAGAAADNTGRNVRDRDGHTVTPMDQSNDEGDLRLTQTIRRAVVADDALSTLAHNVKIVTVDGVVTLRGPVETQAEKDRIATVARELAGAGKVRDQLEVAR